MNRVVLIKFPKLPKDAEPRTRWLSAGEFAKLLWAAVKLAVYTDVTPHTLRHTRISLLLQSGERQINVSNYVKVSQPTIDKVYGHHCNTDLQDMARRLGRSHKVHTTK